MAKAHPQPYFKGTSFICPHCAAYAQMFWSRLHVETRDPDFAGYETTWFYQSSCHSCENASLWQESVQDIFGSPIGAGRGEMLYPVKSTAPLAHPDLPEACLPDYEEARKIAQASPRGSSALLRLCIQKLCAELGQPGKNINNDIAALVRNGLPQQVQQALDAVRVIGNEAVHPGVMTAQDHAEQVHSLFRLVNIIVEIMITQPKGIAAIYAALPGDKLQAIEQRDTKAKRP